MVLFMLLTIVLWCSSKFSLQSKTFQDVFVMQPGELDCRWKLMLGDWF